MRSSRYCRPRQQNHANCAIFIVNECLEEIHKDVVGPVALRIVEFTNRGGINTYDHADVTIFLARATSARCRKSCREFAFGENGSNNRTGP